MKKSIPGPTHPTGLPRAIERQEEAPDRREFCGTGTGPTGRDRAMADIAESSRRLAERMRRAEEFQSLIAEGNRPRNAKTDFGEG